LLRVRGYALAQLDKVTDAIEAMQESLAVAREREADHEIAFTLCGLADIAALEPAAYDEALEEERLALFERLGIVRAPAFPLE
jgi:hypothetical protein